MGTSIISLVEELKVSRRGGRLSVQPRRDLKPSINTVQPYAYRLDFTYLDDGSSLDNHIAVNLQLKRIRVALHCPKCLQIPQLILRHDEP